MAHEPDTTHDEFAKNWSPARSGEEISAQKTKVEGWVPVTEE